MTGIKNMEQAAVLTLKEQVAYQPGQVVSKTLAQNDALSVTLFAFDKGEEISTHESGGDASRSTASGMSCTRASPSSCPHATRTPYSARSSSKCCWSWCFKSKSRPDGRLLCISNSADHACLSASISRLC